MDNFYIPENNQTNKNNRNKGKLVYIVCNHMGQEVVRYRQKKRAINVVNQANKDGKVLHASDFDHRGMTREFPAVHVRHGMKRGELHCICSGEGRPYPFVVGA